MTPEPSTGDVCDVAIIGGGLAGLTTAAYLALEGRSVVVLERGRELGGRAQTQDREGFAFNQGPHALYRGGLARTVLFELGVSPHGHSPDVRGRALCGADDFPLPTGLGSLATCRLLGWADKFRLARLLAGLARLETSALDGVPLATWLAREFPPGPGRQLVAAFCRLVSYAHVPERASAGAILSQFRLALTQGVEYLDGGWQSLVAALAARAEASGARCHTRAPVRSLRRLPQGWEVSVEGTPPLVARAVVLAVDPTMAATLLGEAADAAWRSALAGLEPVLAACLDVALRRLPRPQETFALGVDQPWYFSVHSAAARLAPSDGALIHVARYLGDDCHPDLTARETELRGLLDRMQPGWEHELVSARFLPRMVVTPALATAASGGLAGRPSVAVPGLPGVCLAGDWVGDQGWLADASFASARRAAATLGEFLTRSPHSPARGVGRATPCLTPSAASPN